MHPSVKYWWGACFLRVTDTSVQTSTSSSVATRPVIVGAAVCARPWLTMRTSAPNTGSASTSGHRSRNAVSTSAFFSCPGCFDPFKSMTRTARACAGVVCLGGMLYHSCVSSCGRSCRALSGTETCNLDDCAEGCGCPDGSYYDDVRQRCIQL